MIDYKYLYNTFNKKSDRLACFRYHKIAMTKNMTVMLDSILRSVKFDKDGNFYMDITAEDQKVLNMYHKYDVIDCYNRLGIDNLMYGECMSKDAKKYVMEKMVKINCAKGKS